MEALYVDIVEATEHGSMARGQTKSPTILERVQPQTGRFRFFNIYPL
jgi:hypothetical protein